MSLERILESISIDTAWNHIEHITQNIPSRLAGTENSRSMAEYAYETFTSAGINSGTHKFLGLVSIPEETMVRLLSPEQREIAANTLGHSASTDGIEGELIYVGSGAESEYEGKDVQGKITLSELSYTPARHEKAYIAWRRGSSAQIMMNWGDEHNEAVPYGSMKSAWGNPTPETLVTEMPDLPCVGIARTEGLRLKRLCESGTVRVSLQAKAENGWRPLTMTTAEFGADQGRQFMLLGGHMDSWFGPQATDNAAGSACIMELTRVFNQFDSELLRGIVAGLWMGHETGTMISSTRFADTNWDRLRQSCVAYLQIDQPAMTGTSTWHVHSTDDIQPYATRTVQSVLGDMPVFWHRQQKNGDSSFFGVGLAGLGGEMSFTPEEIQRTALASLGWWHHSIHNTIDKLDKGLLELHLKVYAHWLWGLLTAPVLPHEYAPLGTRFVDRLGEFAQTEIPEIDMGGVVERAREFQSLATELDRQSLLWQQRLSGGEVDAGGAASILNDAKLQLSRVLVPIASTAVGPYGQDRYGHSWQTQMIPALAAYPEVAGYPRDSEEFQVWWVALIRTRNQVADALDLASKIARQALSELE